MADKNIKAPQGFHWMKKGKNNATIFVQILGLLLNKNVHGTKAIRQTFMECVT